MPTWPSGNKPATTTTDADSKSISGARADINKTISNQNDIIDIFNIPSSPTDNYILVYNSSTAKFDVEPNPTELVNDVSPQLGGSLDVNGHSIVSVSNGDIAITPDGSGKVILDGLNYPTSDGTNGQILSTNGSGTLSFVNAAGFSGGSLSSDLDQNGVIIKDTSRNYQILGNQASPSSTYYNSFNNTARVHGVVTVNEVTNPSNRVHSNPRLGLVTMGADVSGGSNAGRIRHNYVEGVIETDGFDNTTSGFGRGHSGTFISGVVQNTHASNASSFTQSAGITVATGASGSQSLTIGTQAGVHVQGNADSTATVENYIGYRYVAPSGTTANVGTNSHFSFKGEDVNATLQNDGPAVLKGLAYPTSDGTNGQVLVTNGSGTLSFATVSSTPFSGDLAGNHLRDSNDGVVNVREGTNAADLLQIYDGSGNGGTDSTGRIDLQAVSTDATGNSIRSMIRGGGNTFAPFFFQGKLLDFFAIGDKVRFDSASATGFTTPEITFRTDATARMTILGDRIEMLNPTVLKNYTVSALPTSPTPGTGSLAFVTDESTVSGGKCCVFFDGSVWKLVHSPTTTAS